MRRPLIVVSSLALIFSGLSISPVQANGGSTTVPCKVAGVNSGSFTVDNNVVTTNTSCAGVATIPSGVTSIAANAFQDATGLTSVSIPNTVVTIGASAFQRASALTSITIPANVTSIGSYAFNNANSLASVTFAPNSELDVIDDGAFKFASSLTTITIPASVTRINDDAFADSGLLNSVYFLGNAPLVDDDAFDGTGDFRIRTAYIKAGAEGFNLSEGDNRWNGLKVAIGVYTATFNSNGGSSVAAADVIRNGSISAPTPPTRSGYKFAGWSATNGGSVLTFPYTPPANADLTLYAKWTSNSTTPATNNAKKSIKFSTSSLVLTKANKTAIKKLVKSSGKDASYVVTGTAGRLPGVTEAQVKNLAKLRANVVKTYLVKLGVKKSNIKVKAKVVNQGIVPKTKILTRYLDS